MTDERKNPCVLALGFFDGVHRGHAALLRRTLQRAGELGVEPAVMTFDVHPDTLVRGQAVELINSAADRAWLIRTRFQIDRVEFFPFNSETMRIPWAEFLDGIRARLRCVHLVVGFDFSFGWKGEGNPARLRQYCAANGLGCDVIDQVTWEGIPVSSTYIRELLAQGSVREAEAFLGHPHCLTDTVRPGQQLGRKLGSPTVNMRFAPGVLVPRHGVYATRILKGAERYGAVTNVGVRPTVGESSVVTVESHLLDFHGDLYGEQLVLEFVDFLRDERKFDSLEALSSQIAADTQRARTILE